MARHLAPRVVAVRNLAIFVIGVWYFDFYLNYLLPAENNLLLFFVAIPIIWASLTQLWTSYSYHDVQKTWLKMLSHVTTILILISSVFIISAIMNTVATIIDPFGAWMFRIMGWIVLIGLGVYDVVDATE